MRIGQTREFEVTTDNPYDNPQIAKFVEDNYMRQREHLKKMLKESKPISFSLLKKDYDIKDMYLESDTDYHLPFTSILIDFDEPIEFYNEKKKESFGVRYVLLKEDMENNNLIVGIYYDYTRVIGNKMSSGFDQWLFAIEKGYYSQKEGLYLTQKNQGTEDYPNNSIQTTIYNIEDEMINDINTKKPENSFTYDMPETILERVKCFCENVIRYMNHNQKSIVFVDRYPRRLRQLFEKDENNKECSAYITISRNIEIQTFLKIVRESHKRYMGTINQRRGHFVTFKAERYKIMRGKTIWRQGFVRDYMESKGYKYS